MYNIRENKVVENTKSKWILTFIDPLRKDNDINVDVPFSDASTEAEALTYGIKKLKGTLYQTYVYKQISRERK